ncbi:TPA: hypothetical protein QB448_002257 [Pasteurella multocida]|nr:hypothetical protein [Pasteurella multocida]
MNNLKGIYFEAIIQVLAFCCKEKRMIFYGDSHILLDGVSVLTMDLSISNLAKALAKDGCYPLNTHHKPQHKQPRSTTYFKNNRFLINTTV